MSFNAVSITIIYQTIANYPLSSHSVWRPKVIPAAPGRRYGNTQILPSGQQEGRFPTGRLLPRNSDIGRLRGNSNNQQGHHPAVSLAP